MAGDLTPLTWKEWRGLSQADKLVRLSGQSLDRCWEILCKPIDYRNAVQVSAQIATIRAVLHACVKMGIETSRREVSAEDRRALEELGRRLAGKGEARVD